MTQQTNTRKSPKIFPVSVEVNKMPPAENPPVDNRGHVSPQAMADSIRFKEVFILQTQV